MLLLYTIYSQLFLLASAQIADNLLPFIGAPQGISFIADNYMYLARVDYGEYDYVMPDRPVKDPFTKYHVHDVGNDLLAFECDGEGSGWFMQVIQTWEFLLHCVYMGSVDNLGPWNKFQTYSLNGGMGVALRMPETKTYLKRLDDGLQYMAATDPSPTVFSTLGFDAGCFQPIEYEILNVTFDTSNQDPATYTPNVVDTVEIINDSGVPVTREG